MDYAKKLDPLSPGAFSGLAYVSYLARDYARAVEYAQTALKLNPNNLSAHATLGWAYIEQRNYVQAIAELQIATERSGGVPVYKSGLARAYALSGDRNQAEQILADVQKVAQEPHGAGTALAAAYLALGNSERALTWLEETAPGDIQANWLRVDPAFDSLRQNARFQSVIQHIGAAASAHE
jgi:tetratricopeptide (TPR) repeat protein